MKTHLKEHYSAWTNKQCRKILKVRNASDCTHHLLVPVPKCLTLSGIILILLGSRAQRKRIEQKIHQKEVRNKIQGRQKEKAIQALIGSYLHNSDKKERHCTRKSHVNHGKGDWIRKVEVPCGQEPLQTTKIPTRPSFNIAGKSEYFPSPLFFSRESRIIRDSKRVM